MNTQETKPARPPSQPTASRFIPWRRLLVVVVALPPIVIMLIPSAVLRIVLVPLAAFAESLDDEVQEFFARPLHAAIRWSLRNPSSTPPAKAVKAPKP